MRPCQGLSKAGKRQGLADPRSHLFYEFARLAEGLQPDWLLIENVAGLLTSNKGEDFHAVIQELAEVGYVGAWRLVDSREFGLPQARRRVLLAATPAGSGGDPARVLGLADPGGREPDPDEGDAGGLEPAGGARPGAGRAVGRTLWRKSRRARNDRDYETWEPDDYLNCLNTYDVGKSRTTHLVHEHGFGLRTLTTEELEEAQGLPAGWTDVAGVGTTARQKMVGNAVSVPVAEWLGRGLSTGGNNVL